MIFMWFLLGCLFAGIFRRDEQCTNVSVGLIEQGVNGSLGGWTILGDDGIEYRAVCRHAIRPGPVAVHQQIAHPQPGLDHDLHPLQQLIVRCEEQQPVKR
jgi:hypothetical protein